MIRHTKNIKLPMYSCTVNFVVTDNIKVEISKVYKKYKIPENEDIEAEGVVIAPDITNYHVIIDTKYLTHNTIAHEVYHTVVKVTEDRGIVDEEAQAWLAGHLTDTVYTFLQKKEMTIKNGG